MTWHVMYAATLCYVMLCIENTSMCVWIVTKGFLCSCKHVFIFLVIRPWAWAPQHHHPLLHPKSVLGLHAA